MKQYIQNAVIDNLSTYYPEYDKELIKAHIYTIFYNCVCDLFHKDGKEIPIYNYGAEKQSYEEFLETFGINPATKMDDRMLRELSDK